MVPNCEILLQYLQEFGLLQCLAGDGSAVGF